MNSGPLTAFMGAPVPSEQPYVIDMDVAIQSLWPKVSSEWVFVLDALGQVGKALHGSDWHGMEFQCREPFMSPMYAFEKKTHAKIFNLEKKTIKASPVHSSKRRKSYDEREAERIANLEKEKNLLKNPPPLISNFQSEWEKNEAALKRLMDAAEKLGQAARDGLLETAYQIKGAQRIFPASADMWNCQVDLKAWAKTGTMKVFFQSSGKTFDCYYFIKRDSLNEMLAMLPAGNMVVSGEDLSRLSPELRVMIQLAIKLKLFDENNSGMQAKKTKGVLGDAFKDAGIDRVGDTKLQTANSLIRHSAKKKSKAHDKSCRKSGLTKKG